MKNQPNAAKLLSSLRNTGYDSYAAIEDIIDNSIDADARSIKIGISIVDKETRITIADNGFGMTKEILDEALKLGSATEKDEMSDLGKYGMGLCTASISMARSLKVITRKSGGEYFSSIQDLDEVVKANDFIKELEASGKEDVALFKELVNSDHGTLVILSKIDRLSNTNLSIFSGTLAKEISRIYRKFIEAGIEFSVNDKKISSTDPLMLNIKDVQVYSDEEYELPIRNKKEKIRVKIVLLPNVNSQLEEELKMNIHSQGFYVLRNNREIANGVTLNVFKKHNDFNRLRLEISFTSNLDNEMGVKFTKDGVSPNQAITDFLKQEIGGQIMSIRKLIQAGQRVDNARQINHEESAAVIAKKSKLLITPEAIIERRAPKTNFSDKDKKDATGKSQDRTPKDTKVSSTGLGARFETRSIGREGALYDCYQEGKIVVIQWNVDHPFYEKIVLVNKDRKDITAGIDFLIYAFASAELKQFNNEENIQLITSIKSIMSANLRALLS